MGPVTHCWLETASAGSSVAALRWLWERRGLLRPCQGERGRGRSGLQRMLGKDPGPEQHPVEGCCGGWGRAEGVGCCLCCWSFFGVLPRLLSAGSSRQSWLGSPRLRMKVRAAQGGDGGKGVIFAPSLPEQHCTDPAGGCPLAWQYLPATLHPCQPWDPNPSPGSASPAVTHPLHQIPRPSPPALAQPSCSSLNPTGVFWGGTCQPVPPWEPAGCRNASSVFGGLP